ncbi:hypothetical protein NEIELOOT_02678 [Neisseria elongata subsp. glycolytica ATCC 29315]|uniref:Uncharacterized protein n=1 Tax=Neisseria elongata subsp. glycolytica ATCC 29315 TaxID=546263 RepID=D4DUB9_NEIEG|nr:hypothetical protein NEIELOOT_02678 [Neisseria elongata subsp. glycolytica ATCC 29315]
MRSERQSGRLKTCRRFFRRSDFFTAAVSAAAISAYGRFYSGLNLNQYGVASPCRTICTVCGFIALS